MHTSARSDYLHCSRTTSVTSRTAVYGPVRTVVWQGSAGDCRPYADQSRQVTAAHMPIKRPSGRKLCADGLLTPARMPMASAGSGNCNW
jgi:hypothetical protein